MKAFIISVEKYRNGQNYERAVKEVEEHSEYVKKRGRRPLKVVDRKDYYAVPRFFPDAIECSFGVNEPYHSHKASHHGWLVEINQIEDLFIFFENDPIEEKHESKEYNLLYENSGRLIFCGFADLLDASGNIVHKHVLDVTLYNGYIE